MEKEKKYDPFKLGELYLKQARTFQYNPKVSLPSASKAGEYFCEAFRKASEKKKEEIKEKLREVATIFLVYGIRYDPTGAWVKIATDQLRKIEEGRIYSLGHGGRDLELEERIAKRLKQRGELKNIVFITGLLGWKRDIAELKIPEVEYTGEFDGVYKISGDFGWKLE